MSNQIKITKEMLEKFMSDKNTELPLEEIEALMDSEVEKSEEEMDTELVDMCAVILAKAFNPGFEEGKPAEIYRPWENEKKDVSKTESTVSAMKNQKKTVVFKRVLLVAAALVIVFVVALPATAMLFDNPASGKIIEFYEDFFKINLNRDEPSTADVPVNDAVSEMIINNLDNFMLPEVLRSAEYEKQGRLTQEEFMTTFYIDVHNESAEISGQIMITQYNDKNHNMTNGQVNIPGDTYRYFKEITIDGKEVIVFGNGKKSYINYSDGATNYEVALSCDFDTMVSIAETINVKG